MKRLDYYFWDKRKQVGYDQGKIALPLSGVASFGNATAFNGFLNNQVESILEKQNEEAVHKINNLQEQMGEYTRQRQNLTNEQTRKQSLETEKYDREIEACNADYQAYQSLDTEKIKKVDTILVSLIKDVSEYSGAMIEHVKGEMKKMLTFVTDTEKQQYLETQKSLTQKIKSNLEEYVYPKSDIKYGKDLMGLFFLILILCYDMFFGMNIFQEFLGVSAIGDSIASLFGGEIPIWFSVIIAVFFVGLIVGLFHYLLSALQERKWVDDSFMKKLLFISLGMTGLVAILYVFNSLLNIIPEDSPIYAIAGNPEALARILIIPATVVGELIIESVSLSTLSVPFSYLIMPFRWIKSLLTYTIKLFRKYSLSHVYQEDINKTTTQVEELLATTAKQLSFQDTLNSAQEIQQILRPLYIDHEETMKKWKTKVAEIQDAKQKTIETIAQQYQQSIATIETTIQKLHEQVNRIKQDMGDARSATLAGLALGINDYLETMSNNSMSNNPTYLDNENSVVIIPPRKVKRTVIKKK